ncbi:phage NrS-1 polymerase family protein [Haloarchaeobius amylolyticus]|uniref:phage NrS-1 polymerase family protein n=1 Tax=Haloarchaeobius amylolyticus TaxID=1198296 RepID=UPI0022708C42|nr:hypothetical protein [Haloarchaeobius amylolyticus]
MSGDSIVNASAIPTVLRQVEQWVCWKEERRDGRLTKIPVTPGTGSFASSTDAETWADFRTALAFVQKGRADGIGFVFTEEDEFVGIDLDKCRDPDTGEAEEDARNIIDRLDSFTEVSPSGTGYHVLIKGELPDGRNRRGSVELYDKARFFTVTGDHVEETPTQVARRQDALVAIHREYVQEDEPDQETGQGATTEDRTDTTSTPDVDLDDNELLRKAKNASNGEKFERLWNGNILGYDSQSEADMALCCMLAFWTGGDRAQMDQLFRQSGLLREKWDEVHYADGSTYGEKTVERAISRTSEYYDPGKGGRSVETTELPAATDTVDTGKENAYLSEKNQLLADRVAALEATLEEKDERIESLETQVERLQAELEGRENEPEVCEHEECDQTDGQDPATSLVSRTKRLLGRDDG